MTLVPRDTCTLIYVVFNLLLVLLPLLPQDDLLSSMDLAQYAVKGTEADWEAATKKKKAAMKGGGDDNNVGTVSIKSKACFFCVFCCR